MVYKSFFLLQSNLPLFFMHRRPFPTSVYIIVAQYIFRVLILVLFFMLRSSVHREFIRVGYEVGLDFIFQMLSQLS